MEFAPVSNDKRLDDLIGYYLNKNLIPREQQQVVAAHMHYAWDHYKYFLIDAPVGVGKTNIAVSSSLITAGAYTMTSTKLLQQQYVDTDQRVFNIMGRSNYQCGLNPVFTADAAPCTVNKSLAGDCKAKRICPYLKDRAAAIESHITVSSYAYLLSCSKVGLFGSGEGDIWEPRELVVMDEAHELPGQLVSLADTLIELNTLHAKYGIGDPNWIINNNPVDLSTIITGVYSHVESKIAEWEEKRKTLISLAERDGNTKNVDKLVSLNGQVRDLTTLYGNLSVYMESVKNGTTNNWLVHPDTQNNTIRVSPLYANRLFDLYCKPLGNKFIFMSGTIGQPNEFAAELGIDPSEIYVIRVDSPFPPERSPIVYTGTAKLNKAQIDANMPLVVKAVDEILSRHANEKGIIHAGNYRIVGDIAAGVSRDNTSRLLHRDMHGGGQHMKMNNQKLLDKHYQTQDTPTVLLSPSMTTGVDLYDDYARFQIIVKLPFLSLGDPRVKRKSDMNAAWYRNEMWLQLLQSTGRATRNMEDHSVTYILDSAFAYYYNMDAASLPNWFHARVHAGAVQFPR